MKRTPVFCYVSCILNGQKKWLIPPLAWKCQTLTYSANEHGHIFLCLSLSFSVFPPQMQMLQVWLQLSEGTGWLQIPSLTEGGPGRMHIWSNSIRNKLEPILWRSCKWITEVGMGNHIFLNAYSLDHLYFVPSVNQISINIDCWVHVALYLKHHVTSVLNIQTGILNTLRTQVWFQWLLQLLSDI